MVLVYTEGVLPEVLVYTEGFPQRSWSTQRGSPRGPSGCSGLGVSLCVRTLQGAELLLEDVVRRHGARLDVHRKTLLDLKANGLETQGQ